MNDSNNDALVPKERINVTFKPANGNDKSERELPFKLMVVGDFTQREDERALEDRRPISINKNNFDEVLEKQALTLDIAVENQLSESASETEELNMSLEFKSIKDFGPASVVQQVPELKQLMQLRDALVALKGPLGNTPAFRKAIESVLSDPDAREKVLAELSLSDSSDRRPADKKEAESEEQA